MRRLIALFVLLALVAATAAPALGACRMIGGQKECCCKPAPAKVICAPDCCDTAKLAQPVAHVATHLRVFIVVAVLPELAPRDAAPVARSLVGLHAQAAPRLRLRI
jgi:hypothetical protein